jgi:hypothetical protein
MTHSAFRERIAELRRELVDRAIGRLSELMAGQALDVLTQRLEGQDTRTGKPTATLDDVKAAFELFINVTDAADLKARIEQLEQANQPRRAR